jgi:N-acetylglucosamine-6-phosphate deacetylase
LKSAPGGVKDILEWYGQGSSEPKSSGAEMEHSFSTEKDEHEKQEGSGCVTAIRIITLAPEVEGVMDCIPELVRRGVTVSMGHTNMTYQEGEEAVQKGVGTTHRFLYAGILLLFFFFFFF